MSIRALTNPDSGSEQSISVRKLTVKAENVQYTIGAPVLVANKTAELLAFINYTATLVASGVSINYRFAGGVVGTLSIDLRSDAGTIYYSKAITINSGEYYVVALDKQIDLPIVPTKLLLTYTTSADFNHAADQVCGFSISY